MNMRTSTWFFVAAGLVWAFELWQQSSPSTGALGSAYAGLASLDGTLPGGKMFPAKVPTTAVYLAGAGAIMRFGFGK